MLAAAIDNKLQVDMAILDFWKLLTKCQAGMLDWSID